MMLTHFRLPPHLTQWFATLSPLWRRIVVIASVVLMLFVTIVTVNVGVNVLFGAKTDPTYVGTPNTAAGLTLNSGHPAGKPLPTQAGTGSTTISTTAPPRKFTPTMKPLVIPLTPGKAMHAVSSDGTIEVTIPANALATNGVAPKLSASTGVQTTTLSASTSSAPTQLVTTQIAGPSGSSDSGGTISFGTYLLQLQDSAGHEVISSILQQPVGLTYHLPTHLAVEPQRIYAMLNGGALPATVRQQDHLGTPLAQKPTVDTVGQTVTASVPVGGGVSATTAATAVGTTAPLAATMPLTSGSGSATASWMSNAPAAYFGKADSFHADLQSGGLSTEVPIDLPSGPGGLTPPVHLAYSSASVNSTHGLQAAAGWAGLGWSLDLGEVTWSEVNATSTWSLSDPYGTSATLVPPNTTVDTYYDDTGNVPINAPTVWHTSTESHIKVVSYTNPTVDTTDFPTSQYASQPPCFRVWLTNGIMEEFGCTLDSRQFYPAGATHGSNDVSAWKLDLITDPSGNQIHITYSADTVTDPIGGHMYPRDIEPATIQWDAPACHNAQTACSGASWQPQLQVVFNALHPTQQHQVIFPDGTTCGSPNLDNSRCDDPETVGVAPAPLVESTYVLNDLSVQATPTGNQSAWNALRSYHFSYSQSPWQINSFDAVSNLPSGAAGELLLQQMQELGTDGSTPYPPETFGYKDQQQHYLDKFFRSYTTQPTATLNRYYGYTNGIGDFWDSTSSVNGGYQMNGPLGLLYTTQQPGTVALYQCLGGGWDHFLSPNLGCEGQTTLAIEGYFYPLSKPPQNITAPELYRCRVSSGDHFVSPDPHCEGQIVDGPLGYMLSNPTLATLYRYYSAGAVDFWMTTGTVTPGYVNQGAMGMVSPSSQSGFATLLGCEYSGTHHVLSDQVNECTGGMIPIRTEGYIPTSVTGGYTLGFYQCYDNTSGVHFASSDPACEGQHVDYQLGYVTPWPTSNCGPTWNATGCYLWNQTNHAFLTSADNGEGEHTDFTWVEAHNNTHNVPAGSGLNALDPTACNPVAQRGNGSCAFADDGAWSQEVLQSQTTTTISATNKTLATATTYSYSLTNLTSLRCSDCQVGMYWGNENDLDYLDFYNTQFKGFNLAQENLPSGASVRHTYYTTEGIGVFDATLVNGQSKCVNPFVDGSSHQIPCTTSAAWDLTNAASGNEIQTDTYDKYGNLVNRTTKTYTAICPPSGVSASAAVSWYGNWDGHIVGELDPTNPATVCDVHLQQMATYTVNGATTAPTSSNVPTATTIYTYESGSTGNYGRVAKTEQTSNAGTPNDIVHDTQYIQNDAISLPNPGVPTGTYIIATVAGTDTTAHDGSGRVACAASSYDGHAWATGQQSGLTIGLKTGSTSYATCGTATGSAWGTGIASTTTTSYNPSGDPLGTTDPDANATPVIAGHIGNGTNGSCNGTSTCAAYDANYGFLASTSGNAFYKTGTVAYTTTAAGGYGLWPTSATDANGQTMSTTYDVLGRTLTTTAPGETGVWTTQMAYDVWCPTTGTALPCEEADTTQRLDASTTVTSRVFYDGAGRAVESRKPGPSGQDVVQYALYDNLGNRYFVSQPYFVTAYTGAMGSGAFITPDVNQPGTTTTYDSVGRILTSKDANSATTSTSYGSVCAPAGTGDSGCFESTTVVDANNHESTSFTDATGNADYSQSFTGTSSYTLYRTTKAQYDLMGDVVDTTYADGTHQATANYDAMKRQTAFTDPDLGSYTLTYDPNGNLTSSVDPRGASGTVYLGYDGLNRNVWKSTSSTGSSPLSTATYDSTASGNQGIGRLTSEAFASGPSQSVTGSYAYVYDTRGRQTGWSETLGTTSYPFTMGYNDAGQATGLTYPDGDMVTTSFSAQDWFSGVTETQSGTTNTLLNTVSYTGANGASQLPTSAAVDNGVYTWNLSYDTDLRLKETKVQQVSTSSTLFDQVRAFDAVGNVTTTNTTLTAGTDNQVFCYDDQNRLVWAGSQGTPSCGTSLTLGTLNSGNARYTQLYSYDVLNRLTSGPKGSGYTYGDTTHLDALTAAPSYTASYDAAGNMTGRNGQVLSYNALRQLISWQNQATSPTQTASYAYNGSGERVQQSVTSSGTTTTTSYIGAYEEVSVSGSTTTTTKYYSAGLSTVVNTNGSLSYLVNDNLGSVNVALTASGGVQATELYSPYGQVRYTNGTMPTNYGYTTMRQDPSGLNYDHARYYDATIGQFISADVKQGPNRYEYVAGNPVTNTDPTGNYLNMMCPDGDCSEILAEQRAEAQARENPNPTTPTTPPTPPKPTKPTPPVPTKPKAQPKPVLAAVSIPKITLHPPKTPSWWNVPDMLEFGAGLAAVVGGIILTAGGVASIITGDALVALVAIFNGLSVIAHGVLFMLEAVGEKATGLYKAVETGAVIFDALATLSDVMALFLVGGPEAVAADPAAEAELPQATGKMAQFANWCASSVGSNLGKFLGADITALFYDLGDLLKPIGG